MPRMYRSMRKEGHFPMVGNEAACLGVRLPCSSDNADVNPDSNGMIEPETGGMSVAPQWRDLPGHRIPSRLKTKAPKARAKDSSGLFMWRMGDGPFTRESVAASLVLKPDPPVDGRITHGVISPSSKTHVDHFVVALVATRELWQIDEE